MDAQWSGKDHYGHKAVWEVLSPVGSIQGIFAWGEKIVIFYSYLNILFCLPVILLLLYAAIIKITFVLSAICCTSCVVSIAKKCCRTNKGLNNTIDFSDVQKLEPEFF